MFRRPLALTALCAVFAGVLAAPPASAQPADIVPPGLWSFLQQLIGQVPRLVEPSWGAGTVQLGHAHRVLTATYTARLTAGLAGLVEVPLLAGGGAVKEVQFGGSEADWLVRGGVVLLRLPDGAGRSGEVTIVAQWPFDAGAGHAVVVPVPAWPSGTFSADDAGLEVVGADGDGAFRSATGGLFVRGTASSAPRVRAARYKVTLTRGAALIDLRVEVEARGVAGSILLAPASVALLDVAVDGKPVAPAAGDDGDGGHQVEVSGQGMRVITARLQVQTDGDGEDTQLELGRVPAPITEVEVRVAGKRSVRFEPEVPVQATQAGGQSVLHAFLPPGESLHLAFADVGDAIERTVRFSAETWAVLTLDEGLLRGKVTVDLAVVQGKATALQLAVPDDVVIASVEGTDVTTWDVLAAANDLPRRVRVGFSDAGDSSGGPSARQVRLTFEQPSAKEPGAAFDVPVLRPLGAFRENGAVALLDGEKVGFVALDGAPGWLKGGLEALPAGVRKDLDGRADQVWRHIGPPPKLATKLAAARVREVRLEARSTGLVRIDERTLRDSHVVVVDVKAGRTDKLLLDLPASVGEPRVVAPSLSRVTAAEGVAADAGRKVWELRFSTALEGSLQLQVDMEQLIGLDVQKLMLPDVRVRGAEVETDVVALSAEAGLELVPVTRKETRQIPTTELPEAVARQAGRDLVAGFRSPRGAIQVELGLKRRPTVTTLDAFAREVWLDTHVLPDGRVAARAVVLVQSAGRPVLRIALPPGAEVLALTVDGNHVKAVRAEPGDLAVPLGGGALVRVEVRYEVHGSALGLADRLELAAPKFDVRQGPLRWRVRLPGDLHVYRLATDLRQQEDEPVVEPPAAAKDDLVPLPVPFDAAEVRLTSEVRDAGGAASVVFWLGAEAPAALGWLLALLGVGLGVWGWRKAMKLRAAFFLACSIAVAAVGCSEKAPGGAHAVASAEPASATYEVLLEAKEGMADQDKAGDEKAEAPARDFRAGKAAPHDELSEKKRLKSKGVARMEMASGAKLASLDLDGAGGAAATGDLPAAPPPASAAAQPVVLGARQVAATESKDRARADDALADRAGAESDATAAAGDACTDPEPPAAPMPRRCHLAPNYRAGTAPWERRVHALARLPADLAAQVADAGAVAALVAPETTALAVSTQLDRDHVEGPGPVWLRIGLRSTDRWGMRRPPFDLAVVIGAQAWAAPDRAACRALEAVAARVEPQDRLSVIRSDAPRDNVDGVSGVEAAQRVRDLCAAAVPSPVPSPAASPLPAGPVAPPPALAHQHGLARALLASHAAAQYRVAGTRVIVVVATANDLDAALLASVAAGVQEPTLTSLLHLGSAAADDAWELAEVGHGLVQAAAPGQEAEAAHALWRDWGRVVARLVRVDIRLAAGVVAHRVLGSRVLDADETLRVRRQERAVDQNLARVAGVQRDRDQDGEGMTMLIPAFLGSDAHFIDLLVHVPGPGPVADVVVDFKDLVRMTNQKAAARASLERIAVRAASPRDRLDPSDGDRVPWAQVEPFRRALRTGDAAGMRTALQSLPDAGAGFGVLGEAVALAHAHGMDRLALLAAVDLWVARARGCKVAVGGW